MLVELHNPIDSLNGEELDKYLERGWFRMGQTIFTTNFLKFNGLIYSVIWLRIWDHRDSSLDRDAPETTQSR